MQALQTPELPDLTDAEWAEEERKAKADFRSAHLSANELLLDQAGGVTEKIIFDEAEQVFHVEKVQDVESVLEWCKGRYNEGLVDRHCEFRLVGSYPPVIAEIFAKKWGFKDWQGALKDPEMIDRLLEDPDLSKFRTLAGNYRR